MTSLIEPIKIKKTKNRSINSFYIRYPEIKKVKFLKDTERNNKGFGEMDKIFKYFGISNYKTQ